MNKDRRKEIAKAVAPVAAADRAAGGSQFYAGRLDIEDLISKLEGAAE